MTHPIILKRYPTMITRNEAETVLGKCCLCGASLVRVDYEWWSRDRHGSGSWESSHETNTAFDGAQHCCDCEDELKKTRNRIWKRQSRKVREGKRLGGVVVTELVTRAPLHRGWNSYFRSIGMQPIK